MIVRDERPSDLAGIRQVIAEAFGRDQEARLVDALRADGDLVVSLVAEAYAEIIGHVAMSLLSIPPNALALAPLSVQAAHRDLGVGTALVQAALESARQLGYKIVFVLGDPGYYGSFGFSPEEAARFPSRYSGPYFMARLLTAERPVASEVAFASAFDALV